MHFDLQTLIRTFGYPLVWGIVFAESGLLVGFLLPGDSLLFVAGFLCSVPRTGLDISVMAFGCFVFAVLGDSVGYYTGKRFGRKLFDKEDSKFFKKKHLMAAEDFFESQGKTAIILARFMPFIRTFAPIVAGIAAMRYRTFMTYNVVGGFGWGIGLTVLGYFLGKSIPEDQIDRYLLPITFAIMFISLAPSIFHILRANQRSKN
ncbi:VTT domain-containing protein [Chamaesiphon sp. GL140_3_metabinner_50]|uniref:DedA family protein n=1 Tax=Chamaesiphon sp. GL140_3_metabinner_50 TaxID=2970812 RepID=UPI0025CB7D75|nr:VTT domain-containing protein [Chamaesiphon sp. GL140_3_metabinner_50]